MSTIRVDLGTVRVEMESLVDLHIVSGGVDPCWQTDDLINACARVLDAIGEPQRAAAVRAIPEGPR